MARKLKRDLTVEEQLARGPMDLPFLMLVLLLTGIGLIMMFSASYAYALYTRTDHDATYYFLRQGLFGAAGVAAMYVMSKVNYQSLRWMSVFALGASIVLLILVKVPGIGTTANGANRWIRAFGPIPQWQPSEAAKLGVILYFSARLAKRNTEKKKKFDRHQLKGRVLDLLDRIGFLELVPYGVVLVVIAGLLLLEPHMSATILILAIGASILFAAGIRLGWFAAGGAIAAVGLFFIINMTPYMNDRIAIWQNPWSDMRGDGYQTIQSLYAIGSGGLFGKGLGESIQKLGFVPEAQNDMIFSIICEELGLFGAVALILVFMFMIYRFMVIASNAPDLFGCLLVVGVMAHIAIQVILNIAVVTNTIPNTGITLPFISYGGTSIVFLEAEMGMVLSVSNQIKLEK